MKILSTVVNVARTLLITADRMVNVVDILAKTAEIYASEAEKDAVLENKINEMKQQ